MADRVSPDIARAGVARASSELADACESDGPSSEVRPLEANAAPRVLHIATRLRGPDAEGSLVTVSDAAGAVHYEGPLRADGTAIVVLVGVRGSTCVRVLLETARWHRQADVIVGAEVTEHAFA